MPPELTIRAFTDDDYPHYCAVWNGVFPEYPETPAETEFRDRNRGAQVKCGRFLAVENDTVVGSVEFNQESRSYHPRKFNIDLFVLPDRMGAGVGGALYRHMMSALQAHDPLSIRTTVRGDQERGLRFAVDRGFVEVQREQESRLDLASFDPTVFAAAVRRVEESGIVVRTTRELKASDPNGFALKLQELHWTVGLDIPHTEPPTPVPADEWAKRFENPNFLWDGNIVALDGEKYVGISVLWGSRGGGDIYTGTTGVLREYRGRGIATALKVKALAWAKDSSEAPGVRTWNEINNNGMLNINFRLGFVRQPAWITMTKQIAEE